MSSVASNEQNHLTPPPSGDALQAENYIRKLVHLIDKDIVEIAKTDLSQFTPGSLQNHYRIVLNDYHVEVSHNKHPQSDSDSYIMLFTNIKSYPHGQKIILAYMHIHDIQFKDVKNAADKQVERAQKRAEEKRLKDALKPIDQILDEISIVEITTPAIS